MADDDDEDQVETLVIPKIKLIYEDPEIDIKMPSEDGEIRQETEEKQDENKDEQVPQEKPIDIILKGKIRFLIFE